METLKRTNDGIKGFASLANIGYDLYEVNLEGEVYKCATSRRSMRYKAERVGNRWKISKYDRSRRLIEQVMSQDILVGCAWYNIDEKLWENSIYADTIRRCKEFFSIPNEDIRETDYKTKNGFSYYVTKFGEVWNTEKMTKFNGSVYDNGYRYVTLGSVHNIVMHRLVAHHFIPKPKDLVDQGLTEESLVVNHLDANKLNNRWDNLEWTTQKGNVEHASINGLMHTTIDNHVLEHVFKRLQEGYSDINIRKETGIPKQTVSSIRRGVYLRYRTDKYTWSKHSVDVREKEHRDELAMKCVKMFNQGMSHQAIADKLGFNSEQPVRTLIGKYRDLIIRKPYTYKLDKTTILSIYNDFINTNMSDREIARKYNVSRRYINDLRRGRACSKLAREYVNSKGLAGYWKGYNPPPK